jgi:hypothetical protein
MFPRREVVTGGSHDGNMLNVSTDGIFLMMANENEKKENAHEQCYETLLTHMQKE